MIRDLLKKVVFFFTLALVTAMIATMILGTKVETPTQYVVHLTLSIFAAFFIRFIFQEIYTRYDEKISQILGPYPAFNFQGKLPEMYIVDVERKVKEVASCHQEIILSEGSIFQKSITFSKMRQDKIYVLGRYSYNDGNHTFDSTFCGLSIKISYKNLCEGNNNTFTKYYQMSAFGILWKHWKDTKKLSDLDIYVNLWIEAIVQPTFFTVLRLLYHGLY